MTARSSRRSRSAASSRRDRRLPRNAAPLQLHITHVGGRGDGVGRASYTHQFRTVEHHVFVPATLAGEEVIAQPLSLGGQGIRCLPKEILTPSAERRDPDCDAFPACGGCTFQHWQDDPAIAWKAAQLDGFLARADVAPATRLDAHISPRHSPAPRHFPYQTPSPRCGGRLSGTRLQPYYHPGGLQRVAPRTGPHAAPPCRNCRTLFSGGADHRCSGQLS